MHCEKLGETDIDIKMFELPQISNEIYNNACKMKPNNEWKNLVCHKILYFDDHIDAYLTE